MTSLFDNLTERQSGPQPSRGGGMASADPVIAALQRAAHGSGPLDGFDHDVPYGDRRAAQAAYTLRAGAVATARSRGYLDAADRLTDLGRDVLRGCGA